VFAVPYAGAFMKGLDVRTIANLDVVLDETCRSLPNGGDHEVRAFVAERLLASAHKGDTTLKQLSEAGRLAIAQAGKRRRTS
jgi:hypothetical protein